MGDLERALGAVLAVRDGPAARRVCLDVWSLALREGEAAGLALAAVVLGAARECRAAEPAAPATPPGAVLGARPPPGDAGFWWLGSARLKTKLKPLMGWCEPGAALPVGADYWAADGSGWWRVPGSGGEG